MFTELFKALHAPEAENAAPDLLDALLFLHNEVIAAQSDGEPMPRSVAAAINRARDAAIKANASQFLVGRW